MGPVQPCAHVQPLNRSQVPPFSQKHASLQPAPYKPSGHSVKKWMKTWNWLQYFCLVESRGSNIRRRISQEGCFFTCQRWNPKLFKMVSDASRGPYDFAKPENITDMTDFYWQSNRTNLKKIGHQELSETIRAGLKAQDPASCQLFFLFTHRVTWNSLIPVRNWKVCLSNQRHRG